MTKETKYHIITYGCQMNISESERIASYLDENGLAESSLKNSNIIILNACSIRQSAIERLRAKIKKIREEKPQAITILVGCVLEKDKKALAPFFNFILRVEDIFNWEMPLLKNKPTTNSSFLNITPKKKSSTAYIPITLGCDNFCSFCVVPYTKGRERHRPKKEIIKEAKNAIKNSYKEIFLLGQNVNSYHHNTTTFPQLLKEVANLAGDFWVRFATSHPKDFSFEIIDVIKKNEKIAKHIHLPLQSGDDEVLKKMNRPYTANYYKEIIYKIRQEITDIAISTDIIVGFPKETEENFQNTLSLFKELEFDMAYIARYSKRPQTSAEKFEETVNEEEKKEREKALAKILKENTIKKNKQEVGKTYKTLITSKNKNGLLLGKTEKNSTVLIEGKTNLINCFANVKITNSSIWGLKGKVIQK